MLVTSPPPARPPLPLLAGSALGNYRVVRSIASGGMATVFAAEKRGPGGYVQRVTLKVPHPHLWALPARRAEFAEEARLGSYVCHPNVCGVLEFGESEGIPYLALEYVRGETFGALCRSLSARTDLSPEQSMMLALFVLAKACQGLEAIHAATDHGGRALSIVHCDVCPENLMIGYNGAVRVIDLGVAVAQATSSGAEATPWRGRCAYMAPERIDGLPFDCRADIWSVGVMLCEALLGHNPYARSTSLETILAIRRDTELSWPPHVPTELRALVLRALARAPADRFASARELGAALTQFLSARAELELSSELSAHMLRSFEQEGSPRKQVDGVRDGASENDSSRLAYATAINTNRPAQMGRWLALPSWLTAADRLRLAGVAALTLALVSATYLRFAAPPDPAVASGAPPAGASASAPSVEALGSQTVAPARKPASAAKARPLAPRRAMSKRGPAPPAVKRAPAPTEITSVPARGVVLLGSALGWADVYEGTRRLGSTPLRIELSSGPHRLMVRPYGDGPMRFLTVLIRPGEAVKVDVGLQW